MRYTTELMEDTNKRLCGFKAMLPKNMIEIIAFEKYYLYHIKFTQLWILPKVQQ